MTTETQPVPVAPPASSLGQTILADLSNFGGWLEKEVEAFGQAAWGGIKALFGAMTAEQYTIIKGLVEQASADENAGMGVEATIADVLTLGMQKEGSWILTIPSQAMAAAVALAKHELGLGAPQAVLSPGPLAKVQAAQAALPQEATKPRGPAPTTIQQEMANLQNVITNNDKSGIDNAVANIKALTGA